MTMTNNSANNNAPATVNSNTVKKTKIIRRTVAEAKAAAERRQIEREVEEIKADIRDRKISEGEVLRRVMLEDSREKGARRGAGDFYSGLGGIDTSLIVRGRR